MSNDWFRPRRYGYGAEPAGWKGWLATALFIAAVLGASLLIVAALRGGGLSVPSAIAIWIAGLAVATILFVRFCRSRTHGEWRWRWGGKD